MEFRQFLFKDAVAEKGSAARIHIGLIAQQVIAAFASEGLDAMRYGIVCYDKWDAQEAVTERFKVVTREETHNEDGSVKEPEEFHYEERVLIPEERRGLLQHSLRRSPCAGVWHINGGLVKSVMPR